MRTLTDKTKQLDEARVKVVDVVQNLTAIAEENAASTEETSASASEVGAIMENISDNAKQLNVIADELKESISQFLIE
ncbi:methyl-accepting chemotaxis sensory transducer [Firmicutes bacterium CAG:534]|nr:methyl-accepting chemotaxis sensory transducer [Firmicutes bacterium CAG:534]